MCPVEKALMQLASAGTEERGAIFTRREVVDFILDLLRYTPDQSLYKLRLLEPSFGRGDFLLVAAERLLHSWERHHPKGDPVTVLGQCIRAVELHQSSFDETRSKLISLLTGTGIRSADANKLADIWLVQGDFLLVPFETSFDFVIGNPPYVRQELIPDALITEYRRRFHTIYDRADLYIPFIERSLSLLGKGGALGFICADRWMKNRYGQRLRQMVAERFHFKIYVDMVDTPAFQKDVIAYPAITIITNEKPGKTKVAYRPTIERSFLKRLANDLLSEEPPMLGGVVKELLGIASGSEPWILESFDQLALVRRLEAEFPTIEGAGCKIGIGVATGADKAFIAPYNEIDVEASRKLPLARTQDIQSGHVVWKGMGIINPFTDDGKLVDLDEFPKLKRYLETRKDQIVKRHVAKKNPANWYRTIDRIYPALAKQPKLLIPDIKGEAHVVYENGNLYPHHNLYFITSDEWNLKALQAVLRSGIARLFVSIYSTRMRGGYLRFQAQYLRRIRLPHWHDVPDTIKRDLVYAAECGDVIACNEATFKLYGLSKEERTAIGGNGET